MNPRVVPLALGLVVLAGGALAIGLGGSRLTRHDAAPQQKPAAVAAQAEAAQAETAPAQAAPAKLLPGALPGQAFATQPRRVAQAEPTPLPHASDPPASEAPARVDPNAFERIEARPPLSDMYAKPTRKSEAKPVPGQEEWRMTRLFNPVAPAAGRLEVKGHKVALAGIEPMSTEEKCSFNGVSWPCGTVARTAFRQWLRSRAVQCKVPSVAQPEEIHAECYIGRADLSEWLVSNGWARPEAGGPYAEAGDKAKQRQAGIYGAPPKRITMIITPQPSGIPIDPDLLEAAPLESTPDELNQDPEPGFPPPPAAVTPPADPQAPLQ